MRDLHSNPGRLLLRHRDTIDVVVRRFIQSGFFTPAEYDDVVQDLTAFLWEKIPILKVQYNGTSLFRTYLSEILRNECLRIGASQKKTIPTRPFTGMESEPTPDPLQNEYFREAVHSLRTILALFGKVRPRLLLTLKADFRIPILPADVAAYWPGYPMPELREILDRLAALNPEMRDLEAFSTLRPLFLLREGARGSPDTIRRWCGDRQLQIIRLLNGNPPVANFNRESLGILFEYLTTPNFTETL